MIRFYAKSLAIAALALLFGLMQVYCACASSYAAMASHVEPVHVSQSSHHIMGQAHISGQNHTIHNEHPAEHGKHERDNVCGHCDGETAITASGDVEATAIRTVSFDRLEMQAIPAPVERSTITLAADKRWCLKGLDPPAPSPVTQKTRLII